MTAFDPKGGNFIKGSFEFGTNAVVYHTNYFAQPQTAKNMAEWFELPAVAAAASTAVKRGGAKPAGRATSNATVGRPLLASGHVEAVTHINEFAAVVGLDPAQVAVPGDDLRRLTVSVPRRPAPVKRAPTKVKSKKKAAMRSAVRKSAKRAVKKAAKGVDRKASKKARRGTASRSRAPTFDFAFRAHGGGLGEGGGRRSLEIARRVGGTVHGGGGSSPSRPVKRGALPRPRRPRVSPAPKPQGRKAECFFKAEMEGEIVINSQAPIDVTISRAMLEVAAGKMGGAASSHVELDQKLIVEVGDLRELKVLGHRRFDVAVPEPGSPVRCQFKVIGGRVANANVSVHFRQGSMPLAAIELAPRIVKNVTGKAQRLEARQELESLPERDAPLDELRIYEQVNGNVVTYKFMLDLYSLKIRAQYDSGPLDESRDKYVQSIMNEIGDAWIPDKPGAVESFERGIRAIGAQMFEQLIPPEMQRLLWRKRDNIKSVQVFSFEPFIPWELVYLKDPDVEGTPADNKFLGELGLLRWIYSSYPPAKLRIRAGRARYLLGDAGPDHPLPDAPAEAKLLQDTFGAKPLPPDLNGLEKLLEEPGAFDLLHICCHGAAAGEDSAQAQLFIDGHFDENGKFNGDALKAVTVEQSGNLAPRDAEYRPIVVLNACESARGNREFNGLGGFAQAFVRAGAGAFVGSHWSIGDSPALKFVTAMYKAISQTKQKKMTLSEAVTAARKVARDDKDATWLAYVVYGHPRASVTVG
jgi:hypothetical protein